MVLIASAFIIIRTNRKLIEMKELIDSLEERIEFCERWNEDMDFVNTPGKRGVSISGNQAKQILTNLRDYDIMKGIIGKLEYVIEVGEGNPVWDLNGKRLTPAEMGFLKNS